MPTENPSTSSPESARSSSSAGLIVVGIIGVAALALGAYAAFSSKPAATNTGSGNITISAVDLENRLARLEQRLDTLEKTRATSAAPAGEARTSETAQTPPGASRSDPQPAKGNTTSSAPQGGGDNAGDGRFDIVPNAELKGRLGRLVVEFPQGNAVKARTEAFKAGGGSGLRTDYGNVAVEMTAGAYDINIGGAMVTNVTIKSAHDTRVHVGLLRLNASGQTRFELFPASETKSLGTYYGQNDVGLPVGTFEVEVNSQRERVTITRGGITEY